jgi:hypothetical protein
MEGPFDIGPKAEVQREGKKSTQCDGAFIRTCCAFSFVAFVTEMNCEASFRCVVVDGITFSSGEGAGSAVGRSSF